MEHRERDRVRQRNAPTKAGDINRKTSSEQGRENSGKGTEFGQNIGRSENLGEGGDMRNKDMNEGNLDRGSEQSRRPSGDSGFGSSKGRQGSMEQSEIERDKNRGSDLNKDVEQSRRGSSGSEEH